MGNLVFWRSILIGEGFAGLVLVSGWRPRQVWYATLGLFSFFAIITAMEAAQGKDSCGCFGELRVRPVYTMCLDVVAVLGLLLTGRPERGSEVVGRGSARRRWIVAGAIGVAWVGIALGMWLTGPVIAVSGAVGGQDFGRAGELVVLEPEKWARQRFSLAEHVEGGSTLMSGRWIVLLVHHDCDHCAAAVPRYVAEEERRNSDGRGRNGEGSTHLAVIEMPPFGDADDPPPWRLPVSVVAGRLDQSRDWFATTPVALLVQDGVVISGKDGEAGEIPDPSW